MSLLEQVGVLVSAYVGIAENLVVHRAGRPGWRRRHDGAAESGRVADGRGWAGDVNDDVKRQSGARSGASFCAWAWDWTHQELRCAENSGSGAKSSLP